MEHYTSQHGILTPPGLDARLQSRFAQMVKEHLHAAPHLASGLSALPGLKHSFASTQAAWRFYANPRVTLPELIQPLQEEGRRACAASSADFVLLVHDWSTLGFRAHTSKTDRVQLTHKYDIGYELATALLVDAVNGDPLAPMEIRLRAAHRVHSTRTPAPSISAKRLDQLLPTMRAAATWGLDKPIVHIIDREADSVGHYRKWVAKGHWFLVRADAVRSVRWQGRVLTLPKVVAALTRKGQFRPAGEIDYKGTPAQQSIAETLVVLHKPARKRTAKGQLAVPGRPLELRLVVTDVRDQDGTLLAQWLLLTNVPAAVVAETVVLWYYWRWRIESYYKLLKGAGQALEDWQQESGGVIAKRLVVASMACVVIWRLARPIQPEAMELRRLLVRLSGRQMKRSRPFTAPAMLAGFQVLLAMLDVLEDYDVQDLRRLVSVALS
jgi:hypothetical protein